MSDSDIDMSSTSFGYVNITDEQALAIQQTITGRVVGPVSAKQFLNFLPPAKPLPKFKKLSSKLMRKMDELSGDMYDLWVIVNIHSSLFSFTDISFVFRSIYSTLYANPLVAGDSLISGTLSISME